MAGPNRLGKLMLQVMDREGYENISELARHTRAVSYQSLYAWITGKPERNVKRSPPEDVLRQLARDFRLPEHVVFEAAGRSHQASAPDPEAAQFAAILRDVSESQRRDVITAAALVSRLGEEDLQMVLRLIRDLGARSA